MKNNFVAMLLTTFVVFGETHANGQLFGEIGTNNGISPPTLDGGLGGGFGGGTGEIGGGNDGGNDGAIGGGSIPPAINPDFPRDYQGRIPLYFLEGYGSRGRPVMFTASDERDTQFSETFKQKLTQHRHYTSEQVDNLLEQLYVRLGHWNTLTNTDQGNDMLDTDDDARRQVEDELYFNRNNNRSVILMGHSYGGDTVLKIASCINGVDSDCITGNMKVANDEPWTVLYLGLVDPVKRLGRRATKTPTANVIHFDNFMAPKPTDWSFIPTNYRSSGRLNNTLVESSFQGQLTYIADWSGYPVTHSTHGTIVEPHAKYLSILMFDSMHRVMGDSAPIERPTGTWINPSPVQSNYVYAGKVPFSTLTIGVCRDRSTRIPGKLIVETNKCYFPHSGKEHVRTGTQYEVLYDDGNYQWEAYNSILPVNALRAEIEQYDEEYYFCKTNARDDVGIYLVSTATCYVGLSGREDLHFADFSILTRVN